MMVTNASLNVRPLFLLFSLIFLLLFTKNARSQDNNLASVPKIGEKFDFTLSDIKNFKLSKISDSTFHGRYLILDFFSSGCSSCFASFPHIKEFQEKYHDMLQFVLIGYDDKYIRKQFEFYRRDLDLKMPYVYDSVFANRVVPVGFPHLIWIDSAGIVRAVTGSASLNDDNITKFISNESFSFTDQSHRGVKIRENVGLNSNFDWLYQFEPLTGNRVIRLDNDTASLFRSEFGKLSNSMSRRLVAVEKSGRFANRAIQGIGTPELLYLFAYLGTVQWYNFEGVDGGPFNYLYGNFFPQVITEISDTASFKGALSTLTNVYWYIMKNSGVKTDSSALHNQMKSDLKSFFGYCVSIEKRVCPCYQLVASKHAIDKLKSKGGKMSFDISNSQFKLKNAPFRILISNLIRHDLSGTLNVPIVDSTGIDLNFGVDLDIECNLYDVASVNSKLKSYGLQIVYKPTEMNTLVVRD